MEKEFVRHGKALRFRCLKLSAQKSHGPWAIQMNIGFMASWGREETGSGELSVFFGLLVMDH